MEIHRVPEGKVHILHAGSAFCGSVPRDWPEGDVWVDITEATLGSCPGCVKNFAKHGHRYVTKLLARGGTRR